MQALQDDISEQKKNWINILRRRIRDGKNPTKLTEAGINLSSLDAHEPLMMY